MYGDILRSVIWFGSDDDSGETHFLEILFCKLKWTGIKALSSSPCPNPCVRLRCYLCFIIHMGCLMAVILIVSELNYDLFLWSILISLSFYVLMSSFALVCTWALVFATIVDPAWTLKWQWYCIWKVWDTKWFMQCIRLMRRTELFLWFLCTQRSFLCVS